MAKETVEIVTPEKVTYEDRWNALIPKIKKAYPVFTDEDLKYIEGSEHKLWALMMKKTGLTKNKLIKFLNSLED